MVEFIPDQGSIIWISLEHSIGREIHKKRPALVLSLRRYNAMRGMAIVVPITSKTKGYSLEVSLKTSKISGYVLVDQIKTIDWKARHSQYITEASKAVVEEVLEKLNALLGIELN